ncbi:MAG: type II toxin-antitoxin system RelE/ParE family toxin [Terriglobia bacterium]
MAGKVVWAESAWNDLQQTTDFIARDSPRYAAAFAGEVLEAAQSLARFAERGRVVPEFRNPTIRELFVRNYRLIYQVEMNSTNILAFIHGSRDLAGLWERETHRRP